MGLPVLGIDTPAPPRGPVRVAKDEFVVTLLQNGKRQQREFINQPVEFKRLQVWLNKHGAPKVHPHLEVGQVCVYGSDRSLRRRPGSVATHLHLRAGASVTRAMSSA
jgi:hypothetical protein